MEIIYPELEEFKKVSSRLDKQLEKLKNEKQKIDEGLNDLETKWDQMKEDEVYLGKEISKATMERYTKNKGKLERDLAQFEDRIDAIESRQEEVLAEYLPGLHEGYKREMKKLNNEIRGKLAGIIPAALPYLEYLSEIGKLNKIGTGLFESLIHEAKKVDKNFENKHYRFSTGDTIDTKLFDDDLYAGIKWRIGLSEGEQQGVVDNGGLPPRHALYKLTGEIEINSNKALNRYIKAVQEQGKEINKQPQDSKLDKKIQKLQKDIDELEKRQEEAIYSRNKKSYHELTIEISKLKKERRKLKGVK